MTVNSDDYTMIFLMDVHNSTLIIFIGRPGIPGQKGEMGDSFKGVNGECLELVST